MHSADLAREECIFLRDDPITNQCYKEALERCGFTAQKTLMVGDLDAVPHVFPHLDIGLKILKARS